MFNTEELQQIINQLQHSQGNGLGYFDTLLLIFKLVGLCAGPILFIVSSIVILIWGPKWISYKLTPVPDNMKLYCYYFSLRRDKHKNSLYLKPIESSVESYDYQKLLCKRGLLRYKVTCVFTIIILLFLSPFLFNNYTKVLFGFFAAVIITGLLCILLYEIIFVNEAWLDIAKRNPVDKAAIEKQFYEKATKALETIKSKNLKTMDEKEIGKTINTTVTDQYCEAIIIDRRN